MLALRFPYMHIFPFFFSIIKISFTLKILCNSENILLFIQFTFSKKNKSLGKLSSSLSVKNVSYKM